MNFRSIHFRLTIWYASALIVCQLLFALAIWASMQRLLFHDGEQLLEHQVWSAASFVAAELADPNMDLKTELSEFAAALNRGTYIRVTNNRNITFDSEPGFPWSRSSSRLEWRSTPYLLLRTDRMIAGRSWSFAAAVSMAETQLLLERLRLLLLVLIPFAAAISSIGGHWLSQRALKPVDEMTVAARSISAANLGQRLTIRRTGDELERLGDTWNGMLSRLEDALKRLTRFTADASHELRTPLAIIRTEAELAARRLRPAEAYRHALVQVAAEAERMTTLLDDLLMLARADADAVDMPKSALNLVPLLQGLCSQFETLAQAKHLQLSLVAPGDDTLVLGNEPAIRRLISALFDNAVKYSRDGAQIQILLENSGSEVTLDVTDEGPGIPESEMALIFERFYRGEDGTHAGRNATQGTGLGLSLAASLAERNNARIAVRSQPGVGSTFRVSFSSAAYS